MKLHTPNASESLHATVWRRAPKSKHSGKKTAEMGIALAVMQHNKVATALVDAVDGLGVSPGAEVVRVASLCGMANSQPCHKAGIQDVQEEEGSGEAAAGSATGGHEGNSMSLELTELCAIQSACFHQ